MAHMMKSVAVLAPGVVKLVHNVPIPEPEDYEALVRIRACGFCNGTDLQIINATLPAHEGMQPLPTLLGHEAAGEVVAVGKKARNIKVGDRFLHPNLRMDPGNGYTRAYGGLSDYGLVADHPAMIEDGYTGPLPFYKKFHRIPDGFDFVDAGVVLSLCESMSAARNFGAGPGKRIVVYGAGPMGLALMKYMRLLGADEIVAVDRDPARLDRAAALCGLDRTVNNAEESVTDALGGGKYDIVVDAAGFSEILLEGSRLLKPFGRVCSMGVLKRGDTNIDVTRLQNNTLFQLLNLPYGEYDLMEENFALMAEGKINPKDFYSHVMPREEIHECIRLVKERKALKVILTI